MSEKRTFRTLLVASAATGVGLGTGITYSDIQEVSDFALGYSIWTHELGDKMTTGRIESAIRAQLPNLPTSEAAHEDYQQAAADALAAYGETVELTEGSMTRGESPIDSLARMTGRPEDIIVAVVPD